MNGQVMILEPSTEALKMAEDALRRGELIGLPTETVYGLAANALSDEAVLSIFEAKGRPRFNPLIVHVADKAAAMRYTHVDANAENLMDAFWPGPLTLVLPKRDDAPFSDLVTAGLDTVALRAPGHPVAQQVLQDIDFPLAAPSANPSGAVSPTTADHVMEGLGDKLALILDGGPCDVGIESTIVGLIDDKAYLLRPGVITRSDIEKVLGQAVLEHDGGINAPGQLKSHYAPSASLRLDVEEPALDEFLIGFGDVWGDLNLSPSGDLEEASRNLFWMLREADKSSHAIAIAPIPDLGLGEAINDRLSRAAAPKGQ